MSEKATPTTATKDEAPLPPSRGGRGRAVPTEPEERQAVAAKFLEEHGESPAPGDPGEDPPAAAPELSPADVREAEADATSVVRTLALGIAALRSRSRPASAAKLAAKLRGKAERVGPRLGRKLAGAGWLTALGWVCDVVIEPLLEDLVEAAADRVVTAEVHPA